MAADDTSERATVRAHVEYKTSVRELREPVAARMLAALDAGAAPDYAALFEAATFLPLPSRCFHTAPASARSSIERDGLRPAAPGDGENWGSKAVGQTNGIYVGAGPDDRGVWAHDDEWDVWEIDTTAMAEALWDHDRFNPGSWVLLSAVPAAMVRLHASHARGLPRA